MQIQEVIPKYIPTVSEQKRQDALSKMSPVEAKDAKEQYVQFRNQKICFKFTAWTDIELKR